MWEGISGYACLVEKHVDEVVRRKEPGHFESAKGICRGKTALKNVLTDIVALTKLNYNACKFASGLPVTLRFADAVGEILTGGPLKKKATLLFKVYIWRLIGPIGSSSIEGN